MVGLAEFGGAEVPNRHVLPQVEGGNGFQFLVNNFMKRKNCLLPHKSSSSLKEGIVSVCFLMVAPMPSMVPGTDAHKTFAG